MNYSMIIEDMEWSYSRLTSFDSCKYRWLLQYILHKPRGKPHFFATYGTFMHSVLAQYLDGTLSKDDVVMYFLEHYDDQVLGYAPTQKIRENFFNCALDYLNDLHFPYEAGEIVGVETEVRFQIGCFPFVGFIDATAKDGFGYHIIDHKSHGLRPRTARRCKTASDRELDDYLRQLYLYSIPVKEQYGEYPTTLDFNCYRHGRFLKEVFDVNRLEEVQDWAVAKIDEITHETQWNPTPNDFYCQYICDMSDSCPYAAQKEGAVSA